MVVSVIPAVSFAPVNSVERKPSAGGGATPGEPCAPGAGAAAPPAMLGAGAPGTVGAVDPVAAVVDVVVPSPAADDGTVSDVASTLVPVRGAAVQDASATVATSAQIHRFTWGGSGRAPASPARATGRGRWA